MAIYSFIYSPENSICGVSPRQPAMFHGSPVGGDRMADIPVAVVNSS